MFFYWKKMFYHALFICLIFWRGVGNQGCLEFVKGACVRCDHGYLLNNHQCDEEIMGCLQYEDDVCLQCRDGFQLHHGMCDVGIGSHYLQKNSYYSENGYQSLTVQEAEQMRSFQLLDKLIRTGEYAHRISRTTNPIISVYRQHNPQSDSFKTLYEGTGGAIILCIGETHLSTLHPSIQSMVVISVYQRIDYCSLYNQASKCERCLQGYYLEDDVCWPSIGGCVSYWQGICTRCRQHQGYLLIQNRCVSQCTQVSDCRSIPYYGVNTTVSTMSLTYGKYILQYSYESSSQVTKANNTAN